MPSVLVLSYHVKLVWKCIYRTRITWGLGVEIKILCCIICTYAHKICSFFLLILSTDSDYFYFLCGSVALELVVAFYCPSASHSHLPPTQPRPGGPSPWPAASPASAQARDFSCQGTRWRRRRSGGGAPGAGLLVASDCGASELIMSKIVDANRNLTTTKHNQTQECCHLYIKTHLKYISHI